MKIKIHGDTPMERLVNITRGLLAVPKDEVTKADKKRHPKKRKRR
jgi:hypothetical protein